MTRVRWTVCILLFFAITINYLDRQLFPLLVPYFEDELRLGPIDLARINVSFVVPYGFGMLFIGWWIDRIGTRRGLSISFIVWNLASAAHALVGGIAGFMGVRFLLGIGESGGFPSAVKTVAEWFPKKERALATGWFNAGSNLGSMLAPVMTILIAEVYGWRACFLVTGALGFIWIFFWRAMYQSPQDHPKLSKEEFDLIHSDTDESSEPITYSQLFAMRPLYAFALGKFFTDAPWWFYLFWLPKFMGDQFHMGAAARTWAIMFVYVIADVGSVFGGWLSSTLIKRGNSVGKARKTAMLICAIAVTPVMFVGFLVDKPAVLGIPTVYYAIVLIALAASAHQGWSCNLFTLASDTLPKSAVAKAVGVSMTFSVTGVAAVQLFTGRVVALTGSYLWPFVLCGVLYLVGLAVIQMVIPRVEPTQPGRKAPMALVVAGGFAMLGALGAFQWFINRPPYDSMPDYIAIRAGEIKAVAPPVAGPSAKVGWMDASWYRWDLGGKRKLELVKFDREGRPIVEGKGTKASKYTGPDDKQLEAAFANR